MDNNAIMFETPPHSTPGEEITLPSDNNNGFDDIDDLYDLLKDDLVNTDGMPADVELYLECNDEEFCQSTQQTNSSARDVVSSSYPPSGNNSLAVNIPTGQNSTYRLTFPDSNTDCDAQSSRYHCDLCSKSFARSTLLLDHKSSSHGIKDVFACAICAYKGQSYRYWYRHMKRKHPGTDMNVDHLLSDVNPCSSTPDNANCVTSEENVTDGGADGPIAAGSLSVDQKTVEPRDNLTTSSEVHRCVQCSKTFAQKRSLMHHKRTHSASRPHICLLPNCKKSFKTSSALNEHKTTVHGEKIYHCNHDGCSKVYAVKRDLAYHQRTHDKCFECHYSDCGKTFRDNYNLTMHIKTHTGQKNIQCQKCDYTCVQKSSLDWHMRKKHG